MSNISPKHIFTDAQTTASHHLSPLQNYANTDSYTEQSEEEQYLNSAIIALKFFVGFCVFQLLMLIAKSVLPQSGPDATLNQSPILLAELLAPVLFAILFATKPWLLGKIFQKDENQE